LLLRAADVTLKEGRKLVLCPREMPLGRVHLRNLLAASELGWAIIPPMLTFYNHPMTVEGRDPAMSVEEGPAPVRDHAEKL
jgi:4-hydroxy-3-polyprenylbenzoate decarboxylase